MEEEGDPKNSQNGSKTTQKPRKNVNEQLKYDLAVLFSLKFIFNPEEWVICGWVANLKSKLLMIQLLYIKLSKVFQESYHVAIVLVLYTYQ